MSRRYLKNAAFTECARMGLRETALGTIEIPRNTTEQMSVNMKFKKGPLRKREEEMETKEFAIREDQ
jgi:hypothetical protein